MKNLKLTLIILTLLCSFSAYALDRAKVTADGLRLRSAPNLESKVVKKMMSGDRAKIIGQSDKPMRIDNIDTHWYKLKLDDGTEGWAFGGYLELWAEGYEPELVWEAEIPEVREGVRGKQALPRVKVNKFADKNVRGKVSIGEKFPLKVIGNVEYGMYKDFLLFLDNNGKVSRRIDLISEGKGRSTQLERVKVINNGHYFMSNIVTGSGTTIKYMDWQFNVLHEGIGHFDSFYLISPTGNYLLHKKTISIGDKTTKDILDIINNKGKVINSLDINKNFLTKISRQGKYIFLIHGNYDNFKDFHVMVFDNQGTFVKKFDFEKQIIEIQTSYDEEILLIAESGSKLHLYKDFQLVKTLQISGLIRSMQISMNSKKLFLIAFSDNPEIQIHELTINNPIFVFPIKRYPESPDHLIIEPISRNILIISNNEVYIYNQAGKLLYENTNQSSKFHYEKGLLIFSNKHNMKFFKFGE